MKEKHFSEPKKYKKAEFWDAISEPQAQKEKKYQPRFNEGKKEYKPRGGNSYNHDRGGYNNDRGSNDRGGYNNERGNNNYRNREERPARKYEERPAQNTVKEEESDERGLR